ncbi:MAG: type II toxin-antitoxin system RelE/ParE family toxin [Sphingomonadales bacterium]
MYKVAYSKFALRNLKKLPINDRQRIRAKIAEYAVDPKAHAHQVKMLQGRDGYRLRVGKWRVIFDVDGTVLEVIEVGARGSIYS